MGGGVQGVASGQGPHLVSIGGESIWMNSRGREGDLVLSRVCLLLCGLGVLTAVRAGGGPETTLLVVNANSPLSLAVANEYIALRQLPERHVLWLDDVPPSHTTDVDAFRRRVLAPIRAHLESSGLVDQVDLIAYSAGFPYAVVFAEDERAYGLKFDVHRGEAGSLTGLTYFARQVEMRRVDYLGRQSNRYFRRPVVAGVPTMVRDTGEVADMESADEGKAGKARAAVARPMRFEPTQGFRSRYYWDRGNERSQWVDHDRYFLSVVLGYTGLRGNSVPEIRRYLARAAASDGTMPEGTVYFMENPDIRSQVRQHLFGPAADALTALGRRSEVLAPGRDGQNGREPRGRQDVIGVVAGTTRFDWPGSGSRMLPGAIAESFTSYGARFEYEPQTKLSAFLRHGAAGSSGTVREPFSFVEKFPLPQMHAYYAEGSSLAEAFYQSVLAPYQLLVVGDPLARPFAHFGEVSLREAEVAVPWQGMVELRPVVRPPPGRRADRVELWVNGALLAEDRPGEAMLLDTRTLPDGINDVRVVAVEGSAVQTRYFGSWQVQVANASREVSVAPFPAMVAWGEALSLAGEAQGAQKVSLLQGTRVLAGVAVRDGRWTLEVDSRSMGMGPVRLHVVATHADEGQARSAPLEVNVGEPATLIAPGAAPGTDETPGVTLRLDGVLAGEPLEAVLPGIQGGVPRDLRDEAGSLQRIAYSGRFEVRESGLYEMTLEAEADVVVRVGDKFEHATRIRAGDEGMRLALPLQAGWHRFEIIADRPVHDRLRATLSGPEVAFELAGERVRW